MLCLALVIACCLGITHSLVLQGPAMILIGFTAIVSCLVTTNIQIRIIWLLPILLATVYFLVRSWLSPVEDLALEDQFLILAAVLFYLLGGQVLGFPIGRIAMAWTLISILCLHLGAALMQMFGDEAYGLVWLFTSAERIDNEVITGMYGYRGSFANFAAVSGGVSLCLGIWGRSPKWIRVLLIVVGLFALLCVCFAQSRSAIVSLSVGGIVMLTLLWLSVENQEAKIRSRFRLGTFIASGLGVVMFIVAAIWVFQSRAINTEGLDVVFDSDVRLAYWSMAVEQFVEHPIFGAGSRSYSYECFRYWSPNLDTGEANPEFAHNEYLQLLADYGIVGFLIIIGLLGWHISHGIVQIRSISAKLPERALNGGSNAMALSIAGVTGMVIVGVHIVADFRTHLLANLLIFVCCAIWVLPAARDRKTDKQWVSIILLIATLLTLGVTALYHGAKQFRGGLPLLANKMVTETGTWVPDEVDDEVWIPSLEKAVESAPSYRRYLRLGALYRLQGEILEGEARKQKFDQAVSYYKAAELRHPYDPVAKINLAILLTYFKNFEEGDSYYTSVDEMASSRERLFRTHTKWADMQRQWAGSLWIKGNTEAATQHYMRALEILESSKVQGDDTVAMRFMVVIEHCRMLDSLHRYTEARELFEGLEAKSKNYHINSLRSNIRREMAEHYLRHAKNLWYKRRLELVYPLLVKAERSYHIHKLALKGTEDKIAESGHAEVKNLLEFFKKTGLGQ